MYYIHAYQQVICYAKKIHAICTSIELAENCSNKREHFTGCEMFGLLNIHTHKHLHTYPHTHTQTHTYK